MSFFGHPLLFAAVAVAAIGVVIYELLSGENPHRAGGRGGRGGRPPPPPDDYPSPYRPANDSRKPPRPPNDSRKPPRPPDNSGEVPGKPPIVPFKSSETSDGSSVVHSNAPGNNLRRRNFYHASNKENSSADSKSAVNDASATTFKKADEIPSTSSSQNSPDKKFDENNYSKNMLDKLTNDTKNINGNIKCEKFLGHNIYEEESNSSESNEEKLINRNDENIVHNSKPSKRKRKSKHAGFKSAQSITDKKDNSDRHQTELNSGSHSDDSVTFASTKVTKANKNETVKVQGSQSSNLYPEIDFNPLMSDTDKSSSCSDEDIYKEQLHETLMKDVYDSKENHPGCSVISSPKRIKEEKPFDSKICRGCEEKHVNTRAYPCNHSYLCVDCAVRIFRLYKKCTICLAHVEEFLQFSS